MSTTNCTLPAVSNKKTYSTLNRDNKVDLSKALKLRYENKLSFQEIADHFNVSKSTIVSRLNRFSALMLEPEELEAYEDNKPNLLSSIEYTLLQKLADPDKLEKASLNNVAYAHSQIFQANRLTRNQSTENVNVLQINADLEHLQRRKQEVLKQLGNVGNNTGTEVASANAVGNESGDKSAEKAVKVGKRKRVSSDNPH